MIKYELGISFGKLTKAQVFFCIEEHFKNNSTILMMHNVTVLKILHCVAIHEKLITIDTYSGIYPFQIP